MIAILMVQCLKLVCKLYLFGSLLGWLGGMILSFLIYGTEETYPYQTVTLVTTLNLFPVVFAFLGLLGIEFNLKGKEDGKKTIRSR